MTVTRYAFIGGGNMATAMISGLLKQGVESSHICVVEVVAALQEQHAQRGLKVLSAPDHTLQDAQVWLLAVKPQHLHEVCAQCAPFASNALIVSVAAGIRAVDISRWLKTQRIIRCMPNTPALIGAGITGLAALTGVTPEDRLTAQNILSACGQTLWLDDESLLDPVTALSGSGPAYVFLFMQSMIHAGQTMGLSLDQARELTYATFLGASQLALQSTDDVQTLREKVTSKGGTTHAAVQTMLTHEVPQIITQAVQAANQRAKQMADEFGSAG